MNKAVGPMEHLCSFFKMFGANKGMGLLPSQDMIRAHPVDLKRLMAKVAKKDHNRDLEQVLDELVDVGVPTLHRYIWEGKSEQLDVGKLLETTPILKAVSQRFWTTAPAALWAMGWKNTAPAHQKYSSGVVIGWGMLYDMYLFLVLTPLFLHHHMWPLVELVVAACSAEGSESWFKDWYNIQTLTTMQHTKMTAVADEKAWSDDEESDEDNAVLPVTGYKNSWDHLVIPDVSYPKGGHEEEQEEQEQEEQEEQEQEEQEQEEEEEEVEGQTGEGEDGEGDGSGDNEDNDDPPAPYKDPKSKANPSKQPGVPPRKDPKSKVDP
jgi:hypothetical protein